MCGRYVITNAVTKTSKIVKSAIQVEDSENYNAHPYQKLPVIKKYKNGNTLENLKKLNRCVAVADGFYEWKRVEKEKIPNYFLREDKKLMFLAGIYEEDQFCLITEEAKPNIQEIHHRQPVILNESDVNRYLNLELQGSAFLKECKKPDLTFYEISKDVNKPTNNSISLIQSVN